MRTILAAAVGLLSLSLAASAGAQTPAVPAAPASVAAPAPAAAPAAPEKKDDPNRTVCKRQEEPGTRLGAKRVCHTAAEWEQISQDARDATLDTQLRSKQSNIPGG